MSESGDPDLGAAWAAELGLDQSGSENDDEADAVAAAWQREVLAAYPQQVLAVRQHQDEQEPGEDEVAHEQEPGDYEEPGEVPRSSAKRAHGAVRALSSRVQDALSRAGFVQTSAEQADGEEGSAGHEPEGLPEDEMDADNVGRVEIEELAFAPNADPVAEQPAENQVVARDAAEAHDPVGGLELQLVGSEPLKHALLAVDLGDIGLDFVQELAAARDALKRSARAVKILQHFNRMPQDQLTYASASQAAHALSCDRKAYTRKSSLFASVVTHLSASNIRRTLQCLVADVKAQGGRLMSFSLSFRGDETAMTLVLLAEDDIPEMPPELAQLKDEMAALLRAAAGKCRDKGVAELFQVEWEVRVTPKAEL